MLDKIGMDASNKSEYDLVIGRRNSRWEKDFKDLFQRYAEEENKESVIPFIDEIKEKLRVA